MVLVDLLVGDGYTHTLINFHWALNLTLYQVFILEGLPAIFCGIYTFFYLPDCELHAIFSSSTAFS